MLFTPFKAKIFTVAAAKLRASEVGPRPWLCVKGINNVFLNQYGIWITLDELYRDIFFVPIYSRSVLPSTKHLTFYLHSINLSFKPFTSTISDAVEQN